MSELVKFVSIAPHKDNRGELISLEFGAPLTFEPRRSFFIRHVPQGQSRANHAVSCDEFLILQSGTCRLTIMSRSDEMSYDLTRHDIGVVVPAGLWIALSDFSSDAMLLVLCSQRYEDVTYFSEPQI